MIAVRFRSRQALRAAALAAIMLTLNPKGSLTQG